MSITLSTINSSDPISQGPTTLNANFTAIKQHIDDIESLLNPTNGTLKLTNLTTIANNSIEAAGTTLTATSGDAFVIAPNGGTATFTVSFDGKLTGVNVTLSGTGSDKSSIADLDVTGDFVITGETTVNAVLLLNETDTQVAWKYTLVALVDGNTGASATTPLDVHKQYIVHLDYYNGGVGLANNAEIKLDTSNYVEGQIFRFHCYRKNSNGQRFWNGTSGNEVFAYIEPNGAGYTSIAFGVKPTFSPSTTPDNQSYMVCQWTNIGAGVYRMVIIESLNCTNVS
jgi:hypothetical protein